MQIQYLGDSYDIVKQSLIRWLRPFGTWSVLPLFTEPVTSEDVAALEAFLGAKVICSDVLTASTDRAAYFACARSCGNLLLDPDTGIRLENSHGRRIPEYLYSDELVQLATCRPQSLTLVFDQSLGRGRECVEMAEKLRYLVGQNVSAFAYRSHACFLVAGADTSLVERARAQVLDESRLPESRFVAVPLSG